jgi:PAS domain S-box-containing protein
MEASSTYQEQVQRLEELERANRRLSEQVRRLLTTEHALYLAQEQLDTQSHLYRQLYEIGHKFNATFELSEILPLITEFVLYELNFERCLVLLRSEAAEVFSVRAMDGYYDEQARKSVASLSLSAEEPALMSLRAGAGRVMCGVSGMPEAQGEQHALLALGCALGLAEYVLFPLGGEAQDAVGLLVAGNTVDNLQYHTRIQPDSEFMVGLANLASLVTTTINNLNAYRALRESEEKYRTLFEDSRDAIYISTPEGSFLDVNQAMLDLFGYAREQMMRLNSREVYADPADRPRFRRAIEQEGSVRDFEVRLKKKDGTEIDCLIAATVQRDKDGSVLAYRGIVRDITERKQAEQLLAEYSRTLEQEVAQRTSELARATSEAQEARTVAEQANQAKSTFLANMSHELRTPLSAILGFSQLMDGDPNLTPLQQENLGIINRSGEHLLALINDVLEMSKIEAGRVTLQETGFDLYGLLDTLEEMFKLRAEEKGLRLGLRRAGDVPRYIVADEGKLRQVLSNLLGNAVKFTREGGVVLRTSVLSPSVPCPPGREILRFEVEDTGPGIAPEDLEVIFEPFVQAAGEDDRVPARAREGTGLGLSISRQFVRLMGGDITASSELGQGSLFQFEVQVGVAAAARAAAAGPGRRVVALAPDQRAADGRPYRLLVVEDKETNRRLLVQLLESLGFEVEEAANGQEALEAWARWQPHLIWMDMRMPVMDGHEATQQIKALPKGHDTVIIALTATAFEEDREQILLEGCDDFIRKPFRKEEIWDMLTKHLGVCFLFEEEPAPLPPAKPEEPAPLPSVEAPAGLPTGWLTDLQQATTRGDLPLVLSLIDQIRGQDAALADALAELAENYGYRTILAWIERSGGER